MRSQKKEGNFRRLSFLMLIITTKEVNVGRNQARFRISKRVFILIFDDQTRYGYFLEKNTLLDYEWLELSSFIHSCSLFQF